MVKRRSRNSFSSKLAADILLSPITVSAKVAKISYRHAAKQKVYLSYDDYYRGQIRKPRRRNDEEKPIYADLKRRYIFQYYPRHRAEHVEFMALDVETTGLDFFRDGIIEISLVHYYDGRVIDYFTSTMNPGVRMTQGASEVNGYTNAAISKAPLPYQVVKPIYNYIAYCIEKDIPIVAHNGEFDLNFVIRLLERYYDFGDKEIIYCDTYRESFIIEELESLRLNDIAAFFHIENPNAHNSYHDACTAAKIFIELVNSPINDTMDSLYTEEELRELDSYAYQTPDFNLSQDELEICKYIKGRLREKFPKSNIFARKTRYGYIRLNYIYTFLIFHICGNGKWIIIDEDFATSHNLSHRKSKSIHEKGMVRYPIKSMSDIDLIMPYIEQVFLIVKNKADKYAASSTYNHDLCVHATNHYKLIK